MGGSPGPAPGGGGTVPHRRVALTTLAMNLASIVERADEGILPAVGITRCAMRIGSTVHSACILPSRPLAPPDLPPATATPAGLFIHWKVAQCQPVPAGNTHPLPRTGAGEA